MSSHSLVLVVLLAASAACTKGNEADRPGTTSLTSGTLDRSGSVADAELASSIHRALAADPRVGPTAGGLRVTVENGQVTLRGEVDDQAQKDTASQIADRFPGVVGVKNELETSSAGAPSDSDSQIERDVRRALEARFPGDAPGVRVKSENGLVILRGTIATRAEASAVDRAVQDAPGVAAVQDDLEVRSP
jgi:osmotically-inducible protein OsmY